MQCLAWLQPTGGNNSDCSSGGGFLASGDIHGMVKLWDLEQRRAVVTQRCVCAGGD